MPNMKKALIRRVKRAVKKSRRKLGDEKFEKELERTIGFLEKIQTKLTPKPKPKPKSKPTPKAKPTPKPKPSRTPVRKPRKAGQARRKSLKP